MGHCLLQIEARWTLSPIGRGLICRRLQLGNETYTAQDEDPNEAKLMAAKSALLQTHYKFTTVPPTLVNAPWNRRTNVLCISDSDDNNNETPGTQLKGPFTLSGSVNAVMMLQLKTRELLQND